MFNKNPEVSGKEVQKWIFSGNQPVDLGLIGLNTLNQFIGRQLKKLQETGTLMRKSGSGGQNKTPPRVSAKVKVLALNKNGTEARELPQ